jgi:hypothetical protein
MMLFLLSYCILSKRHRRLVQIHVRKTDSEVDFFGHKNGIHGNAIQGKLKFELRFELRMGVTKVHTYCKF